MRKSLAIAAVLGVAALQARAQDSGSVSVEQITGRTVLVQQVGDDNQAKVEQTDVAGAANATVVQSGSSHNATVVQSAGSSYAEVQQTGRTETLISGQSGSGSAEFHSLQAGANNWIGIDQTAVGATYAKLSQNGVGNIMGVSQSGSSNSAILEQKGDGNTLSATQLGSNNQLNWAQVGSGLNAQISQSGGAMTTVTQTH